MRLLLLRPGSELAICLATAPSRNLIPRHVEAVVEVVVVDVEVARSKFELFTMSRRRSRPPDCPRYNLREGHNFAKALGVLAWREWRGPIRFSGGKTSRSERKDFKTSKCHFSHTSRYNHPSPSHSLVLAASVNRNVGKVYSVGARRRRCSQRHFEDRHGTQCLMLSRNNRHPQLSLFAAPRAPYQANC